MSLTSEQYIEQLAGELKKLTGKLPLGFEYLRLTGQSPHPGGVDYMGQTATRAMYADLWGWLNENKPDAIVSEEEWQSMYASQNGNVAKYSTGDGATTFRFPRVVGYFKGAGSVDDVGKYIKEGLPNITGKFNIRAIDNGGDAILADTEETLPDKGAVTVYRGMGRVVAAGLQGKSGVNLNTDTVSFDASNSNTLYGNSDHVTPESMTAVMGVIAFGSVVSIGEATEEGIVAELGALGTQVDGKENKGAVRSVNGEAPDAEGDVVISIPATPKSYVTESWKSGNSWYRKYSDGWIEQGGIITMKHDTAINLHTAFTATNYTLLLTQASDGDSHWVLSGHTRTTTTFKSRVYWTTDYSTGSTAVAWAAFGK